MRKKTHYKLLFILSFLGALLLGATLLVHHELTGQNGLHSTVEALERPDSFYSGSPNAPVTVVQFFDPTDESSGKLEAAIRKLESEYPNQIKWFYRYNSRNEESMYAACALEEARSVGRYKDALDTVHRISQTPGPKIAEIAKGLSELGIPKERLSYERAVHKYQLRILRDIDDADTMSVLASPAVFINGTRIPEPEYSALKNAISTALDGKNGH